jgi:hypothetical protein
MADSNKMPLDRALTAVAKGDCTDIPQMNAGSRLKLPWFWDFDKRIQTRPVFGPCQGARLD